MRNSWNRKFWAVAFKRPNMNEEMIIGTAWHNMISKPIYDGEPARCLLFDTRRLARKWCKEATISHAKHDTGWKFRPVRVREIVVTL